MIPGGAYAGSHNRIEVERQLPTRCRRSSLQIFRIGLDFRGRLNPTLMIAGIEVDIEDMGIVHSHQLLYFFLYFADFRNRRFVLHIVAEEAIFLFQRLGCQRGIAHHLRTFSQHFHTVSIRIAASPDQ